MFEVFQLRVDIWKFPETIDVVQWVQTSDFNVAGFLMNAKSEISIHYFALQLLLNSLAIDINAETHSLLLLCIFEK